MCGGRYPVRRYSSSSWRVQWINRQEAPLSQSAFLFWWSWQNMTCKKMKFYKQTIKTMQNKMSSLVDTLGLFSYLHLHGSAPQRFILSHGVLWVLSVPCHNWTIILIVISSRLIVWPETLILWTLIHFNWGYMGKTALRSSFTNIPNEVSTYRGRQRGLWK